MSREFFDAIRDGNLDRVHRLLASNPSLIYEKENGLSPLMVAIYQQEVGVTDYLSEKTGSLSIFEAAATGKVSQVIHHLAHNASLINAYAEDGFQPLGLACIFGQYETAEYLIKAGAAVNSPSHNSLNTAPIQSAAVAGHVEIVLLLLRNAADPNVREQGGHTPLHAAAQSGNLPMIRSLLFNGADLTIRSQDGKLPIDLAIEAGHDEAADLLREGITRRFRLRRPIPKQG